jgi:hypothetical protein
MSFPGMTRLPGGNYVLSSVQIRRRKFVVCFAFETCSLAPTVSSLTPGPARVLIDTRQLLGRTRPKLFGPVGHET